MTEVHFYTGVADRTLTACGLVRQSVARGRKVVVHHADAATLARFDQALWCFDPVEFVPHVQAGSALAARTPVVLTHEGHAHDNPGHVPHHDVLLNLDPSPPLFFSRFDFLLEVIGRDDADREAGRSRWKFYADRGYAMHHHNRDL
ncbi:hypothetical protein BH09PSE6_BH09PSE6_31760 [soil metagenome]